MKFIIEWDKYFFRAAGDLFTIQEIRHSSWMSAYQLLINPSFWGEPHVFTFLDDGNNALLSYAEQNWTVYASRRSKEALVWHEKLRKALRENSEFPEGLPDDIAIARETTFLTANQRSWFLQRMSEFEQIPLQDYGIPEEIGRGEPYLLYGQHFTEQSGFQSFYDWDTHEFNPSKQFRDTFYFLALSVFTDPGILHNLLRHKENIWIWPYLRTQHTETLHELMKPTLGGNPLTLKSIAFDRAVSFYDETRGFPPGVEQDAAKAISQAGKLTTTSRSRILEIGVGTGRIALPLAQYVDSIYGLDLSRAMMLRLRAKQSDEPIYLVQGDASCLPYPDHSFDAAVGVHILHLIPNWQGVLTELKRVLKPNAPFIQCWTVNDDVFKGLWTAWNSAVPDKEAADVGLSAGKNEQTLQALGWRVGEAVMFDYSYGRTVAGFIRGLENRILSRTWRLSDESLAAGVAAVKTIVARDYADAEAQITVHDQFVAKPYYPPQ